MEFLLAWSPMFVFGAAVVYQLVTGRAWDGLGLKPTLLREEHPGKYWVIVGLEVAMIAIPLAAGRTTSGFTWAEFGEWSRERGIQEAMDLQRAGKWADAIAAFDRLAAADPDDARIHYGRGLANRSLGNRDAALADFRRVIALDPAHYPSYVEVDRILSFRERWDELLAMWGAYLARNPDKAEAWYERGGTHFRMGNLEAARGDAVRACALGLAAACRQVDKLGAK